MDALIEENKDTLGLLDLGVSKNSAGYCLQKIKEKNGSFDLTPLLVGSQGTLGIVTEAQFHTEIYHPATTLIAAFFNDIETAEQAVMELNRLPDRPSALEVVDDNLLNFLDLHSPNQLKGIIEKPFSKLIVLVEFDNASDRVQKRMSKRATKIIEKYGGTYDLQTEKDAKEKLWKIRHSAASVITHVEGNSKALPIIEDGIVPEGKLKEYMDGIYKIFDQYHLKVAIWGHAGNSNLHMQPFLDLSEVGDRQKVFRIIDDYYNLVIKLGGSTSGEHNDGRLRGPYLKQLYGDSAYELFQKVKNIFDPHGILNPGVKIDVTLDDIKPLLREDYSMDHLYDHFPRS